MLDIAGTRNFPIEALMSLEGVLSLKEAAQAVKLHPETLRRAIRAGELPATKLGYRTVRITKADLQAWYISKGGRPLFQVEAPKSETTEEARPPKAKIIRGAAKTSKEKKRTSPKKN